MTTCGRCGLQNRADLRFCADCGARLDDPPAAASPLPPRPASTVPRAAATAVSRAPQRPAAPAFDFAPAAAEAARPRCPHCGTPNDPNGRFCTGCGQSLHPDAAREGVPRKDVVTCGRCHGTNAAGQPYCQYCGARLTEQEPPRPARQPEEPRAETAPGDPPGRLVVIAQDGTPGTEYPIVGAQSEIGREDGAIRLPTDPYVSPRHLLISRRNGRFFVRDLESVNGVYVRLRAPEVLRHADLVLIGLEVLRFERSRTWPRPGNRTRDKGVRITLGSAPCPLVSAHGRGCFARRLLSDP